MRGSPRHGKKRDFVSHWPRAGVLLLVALAHFGAMVCYWGNAPPAHRTGDVLTVAITLPSVANRPASTVVRPRNATSLADRRSLTSISIEPSPSIPGAPGSALAVEDKAIDVRPPPLNLTLPPSSSRAASSSARDQALRDPRSNSVRLTLAERFSVNLGAVECVYEERLADGSMWRGAGHLVDKAPAIAAYGVHTDVTVRQCVRE